MLGSQTKRTSPHGIDSTSDFEAPFKKQKIHHRDNRTVSLTDTTSDTLDLDQSDAVNPNKDELYIQPSGLESTLPSLRTDQEAIDEYESSQAANLEASGKEESLNRLNNRKWVKGKSSIYVDAFNLALNTVLEEEENLFSAAEQAVFSYWRSLSYEAQYLYVWLDSWS